MYITEVSPQDLQTRLENGDAVTVIDLRQSWEYSAGHIPGATHIFIQDIPARFRELPEDTELIFQCWHGVTSIDVAGFIIQQGWPATSVSSLMGGMAGWVEVHGQASLVPEA